MRRRVYLAGSVENVEDPVTWRDELKEEYQQYEFVDPVERFDPPIENRYILFFWCLRNVQFSDFILVNYRPGEETWGTPAELMWAWMQGVPILTWSIEDLDDMPNFLIVMSDMIHEDVEELMREGWDHKLC